MRLPAWILERLLDKAIRIMGRPHDFLIGAPDNPYLYRWWVIPRNRWFNIYLHRVVRSDDGRALHDHPWVNCSILLSGHYIEHTIEDGGIHKRSVRTAGDVKLRLATAAHRLEVGSTECWTFFITGPNVRDWWFHCPESGWRHWKDFMDPADRGQIGRCCGEMGDEPRRVGRRFWPWNYESPRSSYRRAS